MNASLGDVRAMIGAYVECALWAGLDWSDETADNPCPLDDNYGPDDVSAEALREIRRECVDFLRDAGERDGRYRSILADVADLDPEQVGHDFYLTRNRHGAGFWDRGLGDVGDRLTQACRAYGTSELYVGDDGALYVHG